MIMQVHDELVLEVADADLAATQIILEKEMINAAQMDVPLAVSIGSGLNWDAAH